MTTIIDEIQEVPIGVITPWSHSFSPFIEVYKEDNKLSDVHLVDVRKGMAYVFITKNGKQLHQRVGGEVKPVLNEMIITFVRLSKKADKQVEKDFRDWVRYFTNFGEHKADVGFGIEEH